MAKVAAIQMTSGSSLPANLSLAGQLVAQAVGSGAELVVLPESFALMPANEKESARYQETISDISSKTQPIQRFLSDLAKQYGIWILGGTIPVSSDDESKPYSTSLLFNSAGKMVMRYDKIHLFDVEILGSKEKYTESDTVSCGNEVNVCDTPFGKVGVAICYDLRFPELFRELSAQGAEIFLFPAAFTAMTGKAHWETLLRARAIENLSFLVAAAQGGYHVSGRMTYGNSMIIDPWGSIVGIKADNRPGIVVADIDTHFTSKTRTSFPALKHKRFPL